MTLFGLVGFPYYAPELLVWLPACLVAVVLLAWYAKRIPNTPTIIAGLEKSWWKLVPLGLSMPFVFFFLFNSALIPIAAVTMLVGILGVWGYYRVLSRWSLRGFTDLQRLGVAAGALSFFAFFDTILEINGMLGMSVVGLAFLVLILRIRRRIALRMGGRQRVPALLVQAPPLRVTCFTL